MRLAVGLWVVVAVVTGGWGGPVPIPSSEENLVEVHEEGLLVLVPTLPAEDADDDGKNGHDLKREVEYELISIPKDVLRREIRQIAQLYQGSRNSDEDTDNIIFTSTGGSSGSTGGGYGQVSGLVDGVGHTLSSVGQGAKRVLGSVIPAAAAGGASAARWIVNNKADGIRTVTQVAGEGLRFAGQLSASVLRVLLQVPAIKARVLAEVIRASQPLSYAISDVLSENSDDLGDFFDAKNDIVRDALEIFIRLVQDTLALKGRIIARLGSSGLDIGATAFNAGVKIGGAFVESAGGVATAIGGGVGDLIRVGTSANFPPPPALPAFNLFNLIPSFDLTRLFAPSYPSTSSEESTLAPLPLPVGPPVTPKPVSSGYSFESPTQPPTLYGLPGR
ncbi:hypothetical protein Pmani_004147 [Petrolisthes manimaculis]|uniref:Uncharacterized protein n=1 Tax=Petrolisthes manimaculis TaxID=1843537 RepID=A0AAE1QHH0_9EUCA|nr:hypothetical protein Pmani_004147 [Petrolisthes manimaculis]